MARPILTPDEIRKKLDCYVSSAESDIIRSKAQKARMSMSAFLRNSALDKRVVHIPQGNIKHWQGLANLQGLLNQLCAGINSGVATGVDIALIEALLDEVVALRLDLMRVADDPENH